jgi:hypothetical protein
MESLHDHDSDSHEPRSDAGERLSGASYVPVSVGELTVRELDLQRRLVRESLLLRSA